MLMKGRFMLVARMALYRAWRPKTFDDVVAQTQVVYPLKQAVISQDIAHAFLFSGSHGTGKTSVAKIFARAINCLQPSDGNPCNQCEICEDILNNRLMDVMEMDAASNNSVDNIRRITDEVVFTPAKARYKVYIIDEVHMLSTGAFNALLKTLEEPPAHAIFILATTEPHRIPATIISRCQRYDFRRIAYEDSLQRLEEIAKAQQIDITPAGLETIARLGDGALRNAISLLDQAQAGLAPPIDRDDVLQLAGLVQDHFMRQLAAQVLDRDIAGVLGSIEELLMSGRDLLRFLQDFTHYLRNLLLCQLCEAPEQLVQLHADELATLQGLAQKIQSKDLIASIRQLAELAGELKWSGDPRTMLEIALISLIAELPGPPIEGPAPKEDARQEKAPVEVPAEPSPKPAITGLPMPGAAPPVAASAPLAPSPVALPMEEAPPFVEAKEAPVPQAKKEEAPPEEASPTAATDLWDACLASLKELGRIDLFMLLRPAQLFEEEKGLLIVRYPQSLQAHFRKVNQQENYQVILKQLNAQAGGPYRLQILMDETGQVAKERSEGPSWLDKLKKASALRQIPLDLESISVPFTASQNEDDDSLPF